MARLLISAQLGQALHRLHDSVCGLQATTYMLTILSLGHQPIRAYAPTPCNYVRNWHDQVALCSPRLTASNWRAQVHCTLLQVRACSQAAFTDIRPDTVACMVARSDIHAYIQQLPLITCCLVLRLNGLLPGSYQTLGRYNHRQQICNISSAVIFLCTMQCMTRPGEI